jgi:predicted kinase
MSAPVVENGLGPAAALWSVRSGGAAGATDLLAALGVPDDDPAVGSAPGAADAVVSDTAVTDSAVAEAAVTEAGARLDLLGRTGDARLAGVLAALLHRGRRARLAARLAGPLGMPTARRVADLVGLHTGLQRPFPDAERPGGLVRMAAAADLGVLHAVAAAVLAGRTDTEAVAGREQVEWSALHAEETGLLGRSPLEPLRSGLREALAGQAPGPGPGPDAADRCWAEARAMCGTRGRIVTVEEALAATWRWRSGAFPRLLHLTGPSGSGKSTFLGLLPGPVTPVSLDGLRSARGSRADQSANAEILREGLARLDTALAADGTVTWDATSLGRQQRGLVHGVAARRDALITHVVLLVGEEDLARRNATRPDPVPPAVLSSQLRRYDPPYPGEAHRTWYVGAGGTVDDTAGSLESTLEGEDG